MLCALLAAAVPRPAPETRAIGQFDLSALPYVPGSVLSLNVNGFAGPYAYTILGPLQRNGAFAQIPPDASGDVSLLASNHYGVAAHTLSIASPPDGDLVAVAAYEDGLVFHDPGSLQARSVLSIAGAAADVAIAPDGTIAAGDTQYAGVTIARRPWNVAFVPSVPTVDAVVFAPDGTLYAADRGASMTGQVSQVRGSAVRSINVGSTPEGLALDARRGRLYVANTNDGTISIIDTATMRELARPHAVDRVFSLALSSDGTTLYATSNQSVASPFGKAGEVVEFAITGTALRQRARSTPLAFPLGVAFDGRRDRIFVTDESTSVVYVLDARTLRALREPLATCRTPWQPHIDERDNRLYIPCARADQLDVISLRTLGRLRGAPFLTGRYPLAVATWHRGS